MKWSWNCIKISCCILTVMKRQNPAEGHSPSVQFSYFWNIYNMFSLNLWKNKSVSQTTVTTNTKYTWRNANYATSWSCSRSDSFIRTLKSQLSFCLMHNIIHACLILQVGEMRLWSPNLRFILLEHWKKIKFQQLRGLNSNAPSKEERKPAR